VRRALAILQAEGPAAIGRLPRKLLGMPAIEALLRLTATLGPSDPRLRLRLAELACDLAADGRDAGRAFRELRCRAAIELANAHRVSSNMGAAQHQLDRAADDIARGGYAPLVEGRLLQIQASVYCDQSCAAASRTLWSSAMRIYRREARAPELAGALVGDALVHLHVTGDLDLVQQRCRDALDVLGPGAEPLVAAGALMNLCIALEKTERWREALAMLDRHRRAIAIHERGRNRARLALLEGELFGHAGDMDNAARAFASCRRGLEAIGQPYEAGVWTLAWAALLERRGERAAAQAVVAEATEKLLQLDPHREVYLALLCLRTTNHFSATQSAIPLAPMIAFLNHAAHNPSIRLQSYLA
jgi:tetratricopeptide (TPR) repeat protein